MQDTKPVQVVMLPQKNNQIVCTKLHKKSDNKLVWEDITHSKLIVGYTPQHLYFLSYDMIKEDDWMMLNDQHPQGRVRKCYWIALASNELYGLADDDSLYIDPKDAEGWGFCRRREVKKIISSTDPSLGLPSIPENWIRDAYVPSNGSVKQVILSMDTLESLPVQYKLSLTLNNEVVIVDEFRAIGEFDKKLDSIDQELDDAAEDYRTGYTCPDTEIKPYHINNAFKAGAMWMKEQLTKNNKNT